MVVQPVQLDRPFQERGPVAVPIVIREYLLSMTRKLAHELRPPHSQWMKDHRSWADLLGNTMVWYINTLAIVAYIAVRGFPILRAKRGYRDFDSSASFASFFLTVP